MMLSSRRRNLLANRRYHRRQQFERVGGRRVRRIEPEEREQRRPRLLEEAKLLLAARDVEQRRGLLLDGVGSLELFQRFAVTPGPEIPYALGGRVRGASRAGRLRRRGGGQKSCTHDGEQSTHSHPQRANAREEYSERLSDTNRRVRPNWRSESVDVGNDEQAEEDQRIENEENAALGISARSVSDGRGKERQPEAEVGEFTNLSRNPRQQEREQPQDLG